MLMRSCVQTVNDSQRSRHWGVPGFRLQDVRATEIDKVVIYDCFRPGDIVRAEVLSLGDARSYYLTTAKNELGVVYARSAAAGEHRVKSACSR